MGKRSQIIGLFIYVGTYLFCRLDPDVPGWFIFLGAAGGTFLIGYPIFMSHIMKKNATK